MADIDHKEFEERADFIEESDLMNWTVDNDFFQNIQKKLIEKGAKLIVGPRGAGKTHQFKHAFYSCIRDNTKPLAIYVSFGKYYHLEPLLFKSANALGIFHSWILAKIIVESIKIAKENALVDFISSQYDIETLEIFIERAEKNVPLEEAEVVLRDISIGKTINLIEELSKELGRKRTILLLDDAALTLTPEYMVEFFDVFRSLKTMYISPKASVYPGTTEYGPRFHVGQDAEEVSAWLNVEDVSYNEFMNSIVEKRFGAIENKDIIDLLKYASFGVPRAFITLIRAYIQNTGHTNQQKFNSVISNQKDLLTKEYQSLALKIPQYKSIINIGLVFFLKIIEELVSANYNNNSDVEKKTHIGLLEDESLMKINRMIKFLIEAGLLYELSPLNVGESKPYKRYIPHYLFLIQGRAFSKKQGFNAKETLEIIQRKPDKRSLRRQLNTILDKEQIEKIKLDLPPCSNCGTERLSEDQKYCHQCGNPLIGHSLYEAALKIRIEDLPIPTWQIIRIKEETSLQTIEDVIMSQNPGSELKKAKGIGNIRSTRIYEVVRAILDEFLA